MNRFCRLVLSSLRHLWRGWAPIVLAFGLMAASGVQASLLEAARSAGSAGSSGSSGSSAVGSRPAGGAATSQARVDALEIEWVADRQAVAVGESIWLALRLKHDPHWHTYWQNPGDSGLPTTIEPVGPSGVKFGPLQWPVPTRLWVGPLANYGYEGEVYLPFRLTVLSQEQSGNKDRPGIRDRSGPGDPSGSGRVSLSARVAWLICREVCIPGEAQLALELPVREAGQSLTDSAHAALIRQALQQVPDQGRAIQAQWVRHEGGLALRVPPSSQSAASIIGPDAPRMLEFFAQQAGWLSVPAPQRLLHQQDGGWRLELALADGAQLANDQRIEGAVRMGDAVAWISATRTEGALAPAQEAAVAQRPVLPAPVGVLDPGGLAFALVLAALGGLILNLMPCVFPVVGLKIASLAGGDPNSPEGRRALRGGLWAFVLGILACFAVLAGLMLGLRAAGAAIGWGFQLQSPGFVAAMALLFLAVGLNFSGVFEVGMSLTRLGQLEVQSTPHSAVSGARRLSGARHHLGAFLSGVLAVLVATPCTAPFMGSAVGLTLTFPPWAAMAVFLAVGAGMAVPYLLLGFWPQALARLPRPGAWMQTLRSVLAFPMYASAAWLVWVLAQQTESDAVLRVLLAAVAVALAGWAWSRLAFSRSTRLRGVWSLVVFAALALSAVLWSGIESADPKAPRVASPSAQTAWAPWSSQAVNQALAEGRPVFVDFTAAWCVSCQANKKLVLETAQVTQAFAGSNVALLRADWTRQDPLITAELARHGRNGVPLYLVYRPGRAQPTVLPELLTTAIVIESLKP